MRRSSRAVTPIVGVAAGDERWGALPQAFQVRKAPVMHSSYEGKHTRRPTVANFAPLGVPWIVARDARPPKFNPTPPWFLASAVQAG